MTRSKCKIPLAPLIAAVAVCSAGCQQRGDETGTLGGEEEQRSERADDRNKTAERAEQKAAQTEPARTTVATPSANLAGMAKCEPTVDVAQTISRVVNLADTNGDGEISKQEATGTANFLVGGFFFRADGNADGKITPEEGREVRKEIASRYPALAATLQQAREISGQAPLATLASFVDIDYGKPVSASEMREGARMAVDFLYAAADGDKDGTITAAEVRTASIEGARAAANSVFKAADTNNDGSLSEKEFSNAAAASASVVFEMADKDDNGQLKQDEAAQAMYRAVQRLRNVGQ